MRKGGCVPDRHAEAQGAADLAPQQRPRSWLRSVGSRSDSHQGDDRGGQREPSPGTIGGEASGPPRESRWLEPCGS